MFEPVPVTVDEVAKYGLFGGECLMLRRRRWELPPELLLVLLMLLLLSERQDIDTGLLFPIDETELRRNRPLRCTFWCKARGRCCSLDCGLSKSADLGVAGRLSCVAAGLVSVDTMSSDKVRARLRKTAEQNHH